MSELGSKVSIGMGPVDYGSMYKVDGIISSSSITQAHRGMFTVDLTIVSDNLSILDDIADFQDPLYPCTWCGTWKARWCSCPKCGAPDNL